MEKQKRKVGRPAKQIDWDVFDKLCAIQCSTRELADYFGVHFETIERAVKRDKGMELNDYYEQKRVPGKIGIRRKQYEVAMNGSIPMLIWLGKQWLGQSEKVEQIQSDEKVITLSYKPLKVEVQPEKQ